LSYKILFKSSVPRDLKKIDKSKVSTILDKIEKELSENPTKYPTLSGKFEGLRKFRVGDYRIIYTILDDKVLILRITYRKRTYR